MFVCESWMLCAVFIINNNIIIIIIIVVVVVIIIVVIVLKLTSYLFFYCRVFTIAKFFYGYAIFASYMLQFYVPMDFIEPALYGRIKLDLLPYWFPMKKCCLVSPQCLGVGKVKVHKSMVLIVSLATGREVHCCPYLGEGVKRKFNCDSAETRL